MATKFFNIIFCMIIMSAAKSQTNQNKIQQSLNNPQTKEQSSKADTFILRSKKFIIKDNITTRHNSLKDTIK